MSHRTVFDCMVYLQAVANESSPAFACFRLVDEGHVTLCVSHETLAEVQDVLRRPRLQSKFPNLTAERVKMFLQNVQTKAVFVGEVPKVIAHPRDPDDEPYLNLAVAAGATSIVSRDRDLLDLMEDTDFRAQFPGLTILDPVAFLKEVRQRLAESAAEAGGGETPE